MDTKEELLRIIEGVHIKPVFQPIISLRSGKVLGYEALSRITTTTCISNIEELFQLSIENKMVWELEQICRKKSLDRIAPFLHKNPDMKVFLNVNPMVIHDIKFKEGFTKNCLEEYKISPNNLIFEITEKTAIRDMEGFQKTIDHYKEQLYEIAIDDAGSCYSGLNLILDIRPHYIKLDYKLIHDIHKDNLKYALIKGMVELSRLSNIFLIAEGIETEEELETLTQLGVHFGQGYFIQRPQEKIEDISNKIKTVLKSINSKMNSINGRNLTKIYIDHICKKTKTIPPTSRVEEVFDLFRSNEGFYGLCIVNEERVVGIITRENLMLRLAGRYGFSLNQKKDIMAIMDNDFLEVDYHTPISSVSAVAMEREDSKLYDFIVVAKDGKFRGTVTIKDLLKKATEIDLVNAKQQNPLTGLPGNLAIEQRVKEAISKKVKVSIMYLDLDNFKAFNDVYGFEKGDMVICALAHAVVESISSRDFAGHVGGDDFVVILSNWKYREISEMIIDKFTKEAHSYYSEKDRENGYIVAYNRKGEIEKFPLVTLTISVKLLDGDCKEDFFEITEKLAKMKKAAKQKEGNNILAEEDFAYV